MIPSLFGFRSRVTQYPLTWLEQCDIVRLFDNSSLSADICSSSVLCGYLWAQPIRKVEFCRYLDSEPMCVSGYLASYVHPTIAILSSFTNLSTGNRSQYLEANDTIWGTDLTNTTVLLLFVVLVSILIIHEHVRSSKGKLVVSCKSEWVWAYLLERHTTVTALEWFSLHMVMCVVHTKWGPLIPFHAVKF